MALLTLKDIGKIYVSEGNVAVGIRGVNLSFRKGEFVAITGKSGSGKSTLLNVISGMDSYEEGELLIDGQPTSHYLQSDWEEYREKYISFIFQDYNIIESFTVLQNVELALMQITDPKERRARAMELIRRVGLEPHIKQKGSKLSGGQKQRTVIARALAKDSPIILADEPTGNLDFHTSQEIIELLREVSKDKLLIVVTHNFEQVEQFATRHIRVFDGAVEFDRVLRQPNIAEASETSDLPIADASALSKPKRSQKRIPFKNGFTLGRTIFAAKPKLSAFLCFLMLIGTFGIFSVTSLCGSAAEMFEPYEMFTHIDGRLVLVKQNAEVITEEELKQLCDSVGAQSYLHFDALLDTDSYNYIQIPSDQNNRVQYLYVNSVFGKDYGTQIIGRYPEAKNEIFLYLPISYQPVIGKDSLAVTEIVSGEISYRLVGVKYYYDNNLTPEVLYTEEGFRTATALHYLMNSSYCVTVTVGTEKGDRTQIDLSEIYPSFDMPADKIYILSDTYRSALSDHGAGSTTEVEYSATYYNFNYYYMDSDKSYTFEKHFTDADLTENYPTDTTYRESYRTDALLVSDEILCEIAETVLSKSYKQASLFFADDTAAYRAADTLNAQGYIAVPSDTTYEPDAGTVILSLVSCVVLAVVWVLAVVFLAFFINLCSSRVLGAFKGDMAIMRSMGIPVRVIRIGMYVRMFLSLIPSFILVLMAAVLIFTTPTFNSYFVYLYAWQYLLIFAGMLALTARTTHKQIRKLFGTSVKKSLKGEHAE